MRATWNSVVQNIRIEFYSIFLTESNTEYNDLHLVQWNESDEFWKENNDNTHDNMSNI